MSAIFYPPSIAEAEASMGLYSLTELAADLAAVDCSGGINAYQIAACHEVARRLLGAERRPTP